MSEVVSFSRHTELGTLIWIGDQTLPEFQDAFAFCVSNVAQLALRRNLDEALRQPAANVHRILVAQSTRHVIDRQSLEQLTESYPEALLLNLLGPLCEGMRTPVVSALSSKRHAWHRWNQVLPQWLGVSGDGREPHKTVRRSVAVVTSTYAAGESLMDLAESAGATAVWCRTAETHRIRNVDVVWWDDSVAGPTSSCQWRERIATFASVSRNPQHAWIVNSPSFDQRREAINGGIDVVVSKPHLLDCLLETLQTKDASSVTQAGPTRRAA
jgi:hypothetical protein